MKPLSIAGALALVLAAACGGSGTQYGQNQADPDLATNAAQRVYAASGSVTAIAGDRITISHGPVEGLGWSAMTMTFRAHDPAMLQGMGVGDRVAFHFRQSGNDYLLTALSKAE